MNTSRFSSIRFALIHHRDDKGPYNAHRAFSRLKVGSVNYQILNLIRKNNNLSRKEINEKIGMPAGVVVNGYRSTTFARMVQDGLIIYNRKNNGYDLTSHGLSVLHYADR